MTNQELAHKFNLLGKLLELHGENPFKTRSYTNAYITLKKWPDPIAELPEEELSQIKGIGKAIQAKIKELVETGEMNTLNKWVDKTPPGLVKLLGIKGFGPKKIAVIWKELGIESAGELLYAINENRLVDLKGFGAKSQATIKDQLQYHLESRQKLLYPRALGQAEELLSQLREIHPKFKFELTGELRRNCATISSVDILTTIDEKEIKLFMDAHPDCTEKNKSWQHKALKLNILHSTEKTFHFDLAKSSCGPEFWAELNIQQGTHDSEESVFTDNELPYFIAGFREDENVDRLDSYPEVDAIIDHDALKGCIHNHTTYSDGLNTLNEMLSACEKRNYEYLVVTDHSKSAFYANGLSEDRLYQQLDEIRKLDQASEDIKLFSGIESDILADGSLDYRDDILADLDVVVASIHSGLKMDKEKATTRLIRAIENPFTSILGHATGRLLLSRLAYPLDHQKVIDACAENEVAIELNANPHRLDMDWRWIHKAMDKGVLISINPDAHSISGLDDMAYGVLAARKGALTKAYCLNAMDLDEFEEWMEGQHQKR